MLRRLRNSSGSRPGLKGMKKASSLRDASSAAAWAAWDRIAVRCGPTVKAVTEVVRPPFERAAFAIQRKVVWPIEDRAGTADAPTRALAFGVVLLLAVAAGVGGLLWAAPGGHDSPAVARVATEASQPLAVVKATPTAPSGPTLHGVAPVFKPAVTGHAPRATSTKPAKTTSSQPSSPSASTSSPASGTSSTAPSSSTASSSTAKASTAPGPPAGPAAISVARDFAGAFVLYETGHTDSAVRKSFGESATPVLSHSLLRRPPSLPANVTVPKAKVVNVVAAPSHGRVYPVSVSLLRVGITSELRLEMEQLRDKSWQVTNVLG
jgi:hypothetical protein